MNIAQSLKVAFLLFLVIPTALGQILGTTQLIESNVAGSDSVLLADIPTNIIWSASANVSWLHLSPANQTGTGSSKIIFTFDANPGTTRIGNLTIAGQTLYVTQVSSNYVAATPETILVSSVLNNPDGVAIDNAGNVYVGDTLNDAVQFWNVSNDSLTALVDDVSWPYGVAVDQAGNVYIACSNGVIKKWNKTDGTETTLVSGLNYPQGVAVDRNSDVFIADSDNGAIEMWSESNSNVTILASTGLTSPGGLAVDAIGNVYIADTGNNAIKEWNAANSNVITLVSSGLSYPRSVAVDGSGNVFFADYGDNTVWKLNAVKSNVTALVSGGVGVAVDRADNLYIVDETSNTLKEVVHAFVDTRPKTETAAQGSGTLPIIFPVTVNLSGPFAPVSDSDWLSIQGANHGVVLFTFAANTAVGTRTAHINLLGQTISVTQMGPVFSLGTTNLIEAATAGSDNVLFSVTPMNSTWTVSANAPWLHLNAADPNGIGSSNVVFTFDANPGATRTGTITIGDQTLVVTQAAPTYVPAHPVTTLASGSNFPDCVAVDGEGNVYFPFEDYVYFPSSEYLGSVEEWQPASNSVVTNGASGLHYFSGIAVDSAGNIFIADSDEIKEWVAANNTTYTVDAFGLGFPEGIALDNADNVYIADYGNNAIKEFVTGSISPITLVSGLNQPTSVALDVEGNVYFTDAGNNAVKKWSPESQTVTTLVGSGLNLPTGVAVDGSGNLYIGELDGPVYKWVASSNMLITLGSLGGVDGRLAVDRAGNVYVTETDSIVEWINAFVDPSSKQETSDAGSDTLPAVLPTTANLGAPFSPNSDSVWLTISGTSNGVVSFSFTANTSGSFRTAHISLLGQTIAVTQMSPIYALGTTNLLEGPSAGNDSVVLSVAPINFPWTAAANVPWLHLDADSQTGSGSTNVIFTFDANPGPTRAGTLTIAGQTLSVTQAGATYIAANPVVSLVSTGLANPEGIAVDTSGNVYVADTHNNAIKKWVPSSNCVTTLVSSGLDGPFGVVADGAGNAYIADTFNNAIKEWIAASNNVITLASSGLYYPQSVALDGTGNIFIADTFNNAIEEWVLTNTTIVTVVSSGINHPQGVSVDAAGNVYIADTFNNAIEEFTTADDIFGTLVSVGLPYPAGVAVDGSGNVFIADTFNNAIEEWTAASSTVTTLVSSGVNHPQGVAVDRAGNVYIADTYNSAVEEVPRAFLDPTAKSETALAGNDALPQILPASANLTGPFAPVSDSAWLTITGSANGVVSFAFTANTSGIDRTANITRLGQIIPVTQMGPTYFLGTTNLLEGALAGGDSVVLSVTPAYSLWTATTDSSWLHLNTSNQSGVGNTNVIFTFDANPGSTRTGTLTIGGLTLVITQAGTTYVAANPLTTLVSSGLNAPRGVAVDGQGNVYIADTFNNEIKEWSVTGNAVTTLVSTGLNTPIGIAVDYLNNVYIADTVNDSVKEWSAVSNSVTTLVSSDLDYPQGVAVDSTGNVYIADSLNSAIKEWTASSNNVATLASSGFSNPLGVAVDRAGNVYIADTLGSRIQEWTTPSSTMFALVSSGLYYPYGVAVDGSGNIFIADTDHSAIKEWIAASNTVSTLVSSGLYTPMGVAVDSADNVYIADSYNNTIEELPHAFVDPTAKIETPAAGSDILPTVLPANINLNGPLAPTSDAAWLTITGSANGVVSFSFTANTSGASRTGGIILLGQSIPVTQATVMPPILTGFTVLANGAFQFAFTNNQGASFSVLTSTNLLLPLVNWKVVGTCTNIGSGQYQFTDLTQTNGGQHFYRVSSP